MTMIPHICPALLTLKQRSVTAKDTKMEIQLATILAVGLEAVMTS